MVQEICATTFRPIHGYLRQAEAASGENSLACREFARTAPLNCPPYRYGGTSPDLLDRPLHDRGGRRLRPLVRVGLAVPVGPLRPIRCWGWSASGPPSFSRPAGRVLGVPSRAAERAWRALSQWRSSWLSREGVLSVATAIPAAIFGVGWVFFGVVWGFFGLCGIFAAVLAAATIYCTGMIYASLKPIHQWRNRWTVPNYFALALMAGFLLLDLILRFWPFRLITVPILTVVAVAAAWVLKETYWRFIDTTAALPNVASATALGRGGRVRMLEPPHTQDNYLLQEMGFGIARKHRTRLRLVARIAAFALPGLLTLAALFLPGWIGILLAALAVASAALGLVVERWLFFAEARHTVTLYYGADAA